MKRQKRITLAARIRQFSELDRAGVSTQIALSAAAADNPQSGKAQPMAVTDLLPPSMPRTLAMLAADGRPNHALLLAAADVIDEPGSRNTGWAVLYGTVAVAAVVVLAFSIYVAPQFKQLFESFGADLPMPTVVAMHLSQWAFAPLGFLLLLLVAAKSVWSWRPELLGKLTPKIDGALLRLPLIGQAARIHHTKRLASWLGACGTSGSLSQRLECLAELSGPGQLRRQVFALAASVQAGRSLGDSVATHPGWLPGLAMVLRDAGAANGGTDGDVTPKLTAYASGLDARSDSMMARLTLVAQITVGVVIGFFVIAMYLPIFKMGSAI